MALQTRTVTGTYDIPDGTTHPGGHVIFQLTAEAVDSAGDLIVAPVPITATLDVNGHFSVVLVATDSAGIQPQPLYYQVTEDINGAATNTFTMSLPYNAAALDLADVPHVAPAGAFFAAGGDLTGNYPNPQIAAGVIVDADINAGANIAVSKINTTTLAHLAGGETITGLDTFSAGIVVSGGSWQVDAQGRTATLNAPLTTANATTIGGGTAHPSSATTILGIQVNYNAPSTATAENRVIAGQSRTAAAVFTLSLSSVLYAGAPVLGASSAITTNVGANVLNQGAAGITNAYGIQVAAQSGASTLNVAARLDGGTQANLWLNSDTASVAGGIAFGTARDLGMYRGGSGALTVAGTGTAAFTLNVGPNAANYVQIISAVAAGQPTLKTLGTDTNITLEIGAKGTGSVDINLLSGMGTGGFRSGDGAGNAKFQVDSAGRVAIGANILSTVMLNVDGGTATHAGSGVNLYSIYNDTVFPATTTTGIYGIYTKIRTVNASFTVVGAFGLFVEIPNIGTGSSITTSRGVYITNQGNAGIANSYGLQILNQTGSTTTAFGARIDSADTAALWVGGDVAGTTIVAGIAFGSTRDVGIFRLSSATLGTLGGLSVAGNISSTGHITSTTYYDVGTNPAASGSVRVPNNSGISARNAANNGDVTLISADASNNINIGSSNFRVDTNGIVGVGVAPVAGNLATWLNTGTHSGTATTLRGLLVYPTLPSTTTTLYENFYSRFATAAAAFTLATAVQFHAVTPTVGAGSAITTISAFNADNQGASGITNAYGFFGSPTSGASGVNVTARFDSGTTAALWLGGDVAGTTIAVGIVWGSGRDLAIYRVAANVMGIDGQIKYTRSADCTTGAGSALLGANCPAVTVTAPYKWLKVTSDDGSQCYVPAWK